MTGRILSDVLEGYALATPDGNDQDVLRKWMDDNPEFAEDLMDFAAARAQVRHIDEPLPEEDERRYSEIGMKILGAVLAPSAGRAPESLTTAAQEKGWKKAEFANKIGLSLSLLMYLEKRRLRFTSIPRSLIGRIGDVLELSEQAIASYLAMPPSLAGEASFKTATRPEEIAQKDFIEAVKEDQTLSPTEKQKLLTLE